MHHLWDVVLSSIGDKLVCCVVFTVFTQCMRSYSPCIMYNNDIFLPFFSTAYYFYPWLPLFEISNFLKRSAESLIILGPWSVQESFSWISNAMLCIESFQISLKPIHWEEDRWRSCLSSANGRDQISMCLIEWSLHTQVSKCDGIVADNCWTILKLFVIAGQF